MVSTSPAILTRNPSVGKSVTSRKQCSVPRRADSRAGVPIPAPVIAPMPVTTTRRVDSLPMSERRIHPWCPTRGAGPPSGCPGGADRF